MKYTRVGITHVQSRRKKETRSSIYQLCRLSAPHESCVAWLVSEVSEATQADQGGGGPSQSSTLVQPRIAADNTTSSSTVSCLNHAVSCCAYEVRQTLNNTGLLDNDVIAVAHCSGFHCRLGMTLGIDQQKLACCLGLECLCVKRQSVTFQVSNSLSWSTSQHVNVGSFLFSHQNHHHDHRHCRCRRYHLYCSSVRCEARSCHQPSLPP